MESWHKIAPCTLWQSLIGLDNSSSFDYHKQMKPEVDTSTSIDQSPQFKVSYPISRSPSAHRIGLASDASSYNGCSQSLLVRLFARPLPPVVLLLVYKSRIAYPKCCPPSAADTDARCSTDKTNRAFCDFICSNLGTRPTAYYPRQP